MLVAKTIAKAKLNGQTTRMDGAIRLLPLVALVVNISVDYVA
jgi:hypothetical protein